VIAIASEVSVVFIDLSSSRASGSAGGFGLSLSLSVTLFVSVRRRRAPINAMKAGVALLAAIASAMVDTGGQAIQGILSFEEGLETIAQAVALKERSDKSDSFINVTYEVTRTTQSRSSGNFQCDGKLTIEWHPVALMETDGPSVFHSVGLMFDGNESPEVAKLLVYDAKKNKYMEWMSLDANAGGNNLYDSLRATRRKDNNPTRLPAWTLSAKLLHQKDDYLLKKTKEVMNMLKEQEQPKSP